MTSTILATPANMKKWEEANPGRDDDGQGYHVEGRRCFAYSPTTGEQYSASSGDYWTQTPETVLVDSEGKPMILAVERCEVVEVEEAWIR